MSIAFAGADLEVSLRLDPDAARAARHHVSLVDRPSPDLRDAVVLLTSELVTRVAERSRAAGAAIELRVWMPAEIVRVEVRAPRSILGVVRGPGEPYYRSLVFGCLADRWSTNVEEGLACLWFEIDRHASAREAIVTR
jgi:hypothetical protein